jgi:hypothetical protein
MLAQCFYLGNPWAFGISPWAHRVKAVDAEYAGPWELPVLGHVAAPEAVLVRPDGYVTWVGDGTDTGLHEALTGRLGLGDNGSQPMAGGISASPVTGP